MTKSKKDNDPKKIGGCTGKGYTKGVSGNPGGRPLAKELNSMLRSMLEAKSITSTLIIHVRGKRKQKTTRITSTKNIQHEIAMILITQALTGNLKAIKEIFDRVYGKPAISMTIKDDNKGLLQQYIESLVDVSPDS